ncbi:unnamed protein product [Miscanthus lutarioriparius]|uniref:Uncharacterized protein n=1 Tax=Miscanthus lutarioriparius TaxID=422564 RepID=A0A811RW32_9POAL|nr:unnamed protein product [Miscanthus lutarioriparius]
MQLLLYGMIKQRPFQTGWYMDMATKYPINFLFVATTSRLFQGEDWTAHENIDMTIKAADSILSQFDLARRI